MIPSTVILAGFMGTGKSEVGKLLAETLGYIWLDLDHEIEHEAGCTIPDIFASEGEAGFRERETRALFRLGEQPGTVLSCGGGVVVTPQNLEWLIKQPGVICLDADAATIYARIGQDPNRPKLQGEDAKQRIAELMMERAPLYARLSAHVDTQHFRPSEVVEAILSEFRNRT